MEVVREGFLLRTLSCVFDLWAMPPSTFHSLRTLNTLLTNLSLSLILRNVCMFTSVNVMCLCHWAREEVRGQHCTWVLAFSCLLHGVLLLVTAYARLCRPKLPGVLCPSPVSPQEHKDYSPLLPCLDLV